MSRALYRIAVILPVEPEYASRVLEGAISYADETPEIELVQMPYLRKGGSPLPEPPYSFDGAFTQLSVHDTWVLPLLEAKVPVVNTSGDWWDRGPLSVGFCGGSTVKGAVAHLKGLGHEHLAYVGEATSESISYKGAESFFLKLVAEAGLSSFRHEIGRVAEIENRLSKLPEAAAAALQTFLRDLPKPAGIYCEDDYVARVVCDEAIRLGFHIPDDLAVLGLGDYSVARLGSPSISSIPQPGKLIGIRAVELLHHILDGSEEPGNDTLPSPPVVLRESTGGGGVTDERFLVIRQRIHDHACEGLSVNDLLEMLPMSRFTFSKLFVRHFGCTPGEEIRKVKTERAKEYLRTTDYSIVCIADLCGFKQQGKFSTFFKRQTGRTPTEYRHSEEQ